MKYYKKIEDGIITQFGTCISVHSSQIEINEDEWNTLIQIHAERPADTLESVYRLSAETEQYIPYPRTHEETVAWYVEQVNSGEMTLEEVPEDYRAEAEAIITPQPSDDYTAGYDQAVLDMIESGVL